MKNFIEWTEGDNQRARKIVLFGLFIFFISVSLLAFALIFTGFDIKSGESYYYTFASVLTASFGAHMALKPSPNSTNDLAKKPRLP